MTTDKQLVVVTVNLRADSRDTRTVLSKAENWAATMEVKWVDRWASQKVAWKVLLLAGSVVVKMVGMLVTCLVDCLAKCWAGYSGMCLTVRMVSRMAEPMAGLMVHWTAPLRVGRLALRMVALMVEPMDPLVVGQSVALTGEQLAAGLAVH